MGLIANIINNKIQCTQILLNLHVSLLTGLVGPLINLFLVRAMNARARLPLRAGSPERSSLHVTVSEAYVTSSKMSLYTQLLKIPISHFLGQLW